MHNKKLEISPMPHKIESPTDNLNDIYRYPIKLVIVPILRAVKAFFFGSPCMLCYLVYQIEDFGKKIF